MKLRVGLVTMWRQRCGIASYSERLADALGKLGVEVYVLRVPRFGTLTAEVLRNVAESTPRRVQLLHVQHEYGRYQGLEGGFYASLKATGKPIVTTMHAVGNPNVDAVVASTSRRVIVHNEYCRRHFIAPEVATIIPHGCQPVKPTRQREARLALGIPPRVKVVGYCGYISVNKGLELAIQAMEQLPHAALMVAGGWFTEAETAYLAELKRGSQERLPGRCVWLGWVEDERLPHVYGAMDVTVYPARYATESGALLMALSHGKAVVANSLPPFEEKRRVGALETFHGVGDLAKKLKRLLRKPEARRRLERGARMYTRRNSWLRVAKKHVQLYREVLREKRG